VEARGRGRVGKTSERSTLGEDRLDGHRVTPAHRERTLRMLEPLKPRSAPPFVLADDGARSMSNGKRGRSRREM